MDYIALAAAPGIAICIYIFYKDVYNREPKINLIISFILGALIIIPAAEIERYFMQFVPIGTRWNAFVFAFLVVGFTEEFCKFIPLRYYSYRLKSFDEPFDGIVYSLMVSMGFATAENILYVTQYAQHGLGYQVAFQRMFTSVPAHATFGIMMGYFAGNAKFSKKNEWWLLIAGLLLATFFHGLYDFFLFLKEFSLADKHLSDLLMLGGAVTSLIIAIILSKKLIKQHRKISARLFSPQQSESTLKIQPAGISDINTIQQLAQEIWPTAYQEILSEEQLHYMLDKMYNPIALETQLKNGSIFLIAYRNKQPVGFAAYTFTDVSMAKLDKLYVLPSEQGKGTGKELLNQVIILLSKSNIEKIRLQVNRNNKARFFYEKRGFQIIQSADFDIGNGFFMNDYIMEKSLI